MQTSIARYVRLPVCDARSRDVVLGFFDNNLDFLKLWARRGYRCFSFGPTHPPFGRDEAHGIELRHFRLDADNDLDALVSEFAGDVAFALAAPPCPGLVLAGARWWAAKADEDPHFQRREADAIARLHSALTGLRCAYTMLVPATGRLQMLWKKPQFTFDPCDYGGYLGSGDSHPHYPAVFPPRDAYRKLTAVYTNVGLEAPAPRPVQPVYKELKRASGGTRLATPTTCAHFGTTSVRSCLPRGFLHAITKKYARGTRAASVSVCAFVEARKVERGVRVRCRNRRGFKRVRVSVEWSA